MHLLVTVSATGERGSSSCPVKHFKAPDQMFRQYNRIGVEGASSVCEVTWLESQFLALRSTSLPTVEEWEPRFINPSSLKAPWHKTAACPMPRILLPQPLIPSAMRTLAPHHHTCWCVSPRRSQHPPPPPLPPPIVSQAEERPPPSASPASPCGRSPTPPRWGRGSPRTETGPTCR